MTQPTVDQSNTAMDIETAVATITAAAGGNVGSKDVVSSLTTLNVALEGRNAAQVLAFTEQHPLSPEQLAMLMPALEDEHSVNLVCRVLEKLLVPLNYQAVQERFQPLLLAGFDDPNASVRKLVLSAVSKAAQSEDAVLLLVASDVFPALLECLSFADIEVGEITARILVEVAKYHTGFQALFGDTSVSILSQLTGGDDVVKFRVYDLVARVSSTSDEALGLAQRSGLLQLMIEDLESDDILTALNIIELFSKLIETDVGLSFLETAGVLPQLVSVLQEEAVDDVSAVLYRCGVIKFFGRLAVHQPEALKSAQGKYNIFGLLDRQLESPSRELKEAALVAIGNIGSTCTGLRSLDAQNALLASFTDTYRSSAGPTKIIAMQSLSYLLGVSEAPDNEISSITNRIYTGLGGRSGQLEELMGYAKSAFDETRIAAYAVLKGMAFHPWGLAEINNSPSFVNFILDRTLETQAVGKEWRFSIVQIVIRNAKSPDVLDEHTLQRFRRYHGEGPYYVPVQAAVALQSS